MVFIKKREGRHGPNICKGEKMDKTDKEDLLNINGGNNKKDLKKILIYGAAIFLIFVIGVIGFAIYKNSKSNNQNSILPPQVKQEPLFKEVPIEQNVTQKTNINVKAKANKTEGNATENNTQNIKKNLLQNLQQSNTGKKQESVNKENKPKEISKNQVKNSVNNTKKHTSFISGKKYYIQVAALLKFKKPNRKFLRLIEKYGYKYRFYQTYIKSNTKKIKVTKILIGPFKTKDEAVKNLKKVKKYIIQNAFIFKVK